jgi:serine/threonine protein kinase
MFEQAEGYQFLSQISREQTTVLWKAVHPAKGEQVVLKLPQPGCGQIDNEIKIIFDLRHDHILKPIDVVSTAFGSGLVLPLARGGDLFWHVDQGHLDTATVKKIAFHLLSALAFLHKNGVWHQDIKLENILVMDPDNIGDSVVLADFGLAKEYAHGAESLDFCGSSFYLAPELVMRMPFTEKIDVWALGITLVACLTREMPFDIRSSAATNQSIVEGLPHLESLLADHQIPAEPAELLRRMLARSPDDRWSASKALESTWFDDLRPPTVAENQRRMALDSTMD